MSLASRLAELITAVGSDVKSIRAALDGLKTSGVNPWVEGVPLYNYGHSIVMYPGLYNTPYTGEMVERIRTRLNMGRLFPMARSGTPAVDNVPMMLSSGGLVQPNGLSGSRQWVPDRRGVVLYQNYGNEIAGVTGAQPTYVNQWKHMVRTALALFGTKQILSVEDAVRSGTWTKQVGGREWFWNDCSYVSSTVGNYCRFSVPSGDTAWVLIANSASSYNTGQVAVKCNGVTLRTITTQGEMQAYTSVHVGAPTRNYLPTAYKITGLNAAAGTTGAKNLDIVVNEAKTVFVSAVFVPSSTPPRVFYGLDYVRLAPSNGWQNAQTYEPVYRAAALEVCAEFPYVTTVDLNEGWSQSMVSSLDASQVAHPNDWGMKHMADKYVAAINGPQGITGPDPGVMTL